MRIGHVHLQFQDLAGAVAWMSGVLDKKPTFQNQGMAVFAFENIEYVFDAASTDTEATIAIDSQNCDTAIERIRKNGGEILEEPADQPWGVRVAYFKGPGNLTFEIEQALKG